MAWTFDPALPTARDRARLAVADTVSTDPLLQDETYDALITGFAPDELRAQVAAAKSIAALFSRRATEEKEGDEQSNFADRGQAYLELANQLSQQSGSAVVVGQLIGPPRPICGFGSFEAYGPLGCNRYLPR